MGEASTVAQTVAAFEAALDAAVTAVGISDWDAARNALVQASIIQVSLPRTWIDGAMVDYKLQVSAVLEMLTDAEERSNRSNRRMITTRTAHGRRTGRGGRGPYLNPPF